MTGRSGKWRWTGSVVVVVSLLGVSHAPAAVVGYYTPESGDLSLLVGDVVPDTLLCYLLQPAAPNAFRSEHHRPILGVLHYDSVPQQIGECRIAPPLPAGLYTLGRILPEGLNPAELEGYFSATDYVTKLGWGRRRITLNYGPSDLNPVNGGDPIIPEPVVYARAARLVYDYRTGNLTINAQGPDGGTFLALQLFDRLGRFRVDQLSNDLGPHDFSSHQFAIGDEKGFRTGTLDLGSILPKGLSRADLTAGLSGFMISRPGAGQVPLGVSGPEELSGDWKSLELVVIPEPSTALGLFGLGWTLIQARSRRRS